MKKKWIPAWPALALIGIVSVLAAVAWGTVPRGQEKTRPAAVERTEIVLSEVYTVDRIYRSMMGPWSGQEIVLGDPDRDEQVWITGYSADMVAADGETQVPQDFMCHSNLDLDASEHMRKMGTHPAFSSRLFTLSQGQLEIELPAGFGIPVRSSEPLDLTTQVLNLNHQGDPVEVRHRVSVRYALGREVGQGMVPLMPIAAYGLALTEGKDGYYGVANPDAEAHGPGCLVGESASDHGYDDGLGRTFSGHWLVPPGRQENRTLVTRLMQVPFETTIHYIAVHLHPFAESLKLKDLTTGEVLFESRAEGFADRIGLARVDAFASQEGIAVFPDHEYELVSVYNNTSETTQDSMAVMYIYIRDVLLEQRMAEASKS